MTTPLVLLLIILAAVVGATACFYNLLHARDPGSPERRERRPLHWLLFGVNAVILGSVGEGFRRQCRDECLEVWVALLIFAVLAAALPVWFGIRCKQRQVAFSRWYRHLGRLTLALALLSGVGCSTYSADRYPDGGVHVGGTSLITDKGIQRARVDGLGELEGYNSNSNADAMRAFGEGLGAGLRKAAEAGK